MTIKRVMNPIFVVSISVAVLGGLLLVASQALGMITGQVALLEVFNGWFKTVLCIAASIASIAVYFTLYARPGSDTGTDAGGQGSGEAR
ncbi:hypothetical protein AB0K08_07460 [Citricoccus sp. NPDC055426]|uniref:hypothetical protein n=1 Tax=Citricoccus sp. NPDC055426 TaxID=3155536 RepID=UPI00342A1AC4